MLSKNEKKLSKFLKDKDHPTKRPRYDLNDPHSHNKKFHYKRQLDESDIVKIMPAQKIYFGSCIG